MFSFFGIFKVRGNSMAPILKDDDYLVVLRNKFNWLPSLGSIVVVDHPDLGKIVKKVSSVDGDTFSLAGLTSSSISQSHLGQISSANYWGRVIWIFRK